MIKVPNNTENKVLSFVRQNDKDKVFAVFNFSDNNHTVEFSETLYHGNYKNFTTGDSVTLGENTHFDLKPWAYKVYVK